jgi:hypothetical protein
MQLRPVPAPSSYEVGNAICMSETTGDNRNRFLLKRFITVHKHQWQGMSDRGFWFLNAVF